MNSDLEVKTTQFRDEMGGITLQCQLGEPDVQSKIPAELNGLQLFQLATEQSLKNHQAERRTAESKSSPAEKSDQTLLPWTGRNRQQSGGKDHRDRGCPSGTNT